jgi:sensor histidine kinase YesM
MRKIFSNRFSWIALTLLLIDIGFYIMLRREGVTHSAAFSDVFNTYFWLLLFSFILQRIHSFYHSRSAVNVVHIGIITVFSLLTALLTYWYGQWFSDDQIYLQLSYRLFYIRWFILFLIFLAIVNQLWISKHIQEQNNALKRLLEKERQLTKAEINNLQQQFQPHFLFNSLNSINALVKSQPEKAREMLFNLSDFLRMTIQKGKEEFNSVSDEINYLNLYMSIEKVRFGDRLSVEIEEDEHCKNAMLPSLILQPLVENSVKYGLNSHTGLITIKIAISFVSNDLLISIENPYDKDAVASGKGTGFGLKSIDRKLKFLYKRADLMHVFQNDHLFRVTIKIPQK